MLKPITQRQAREYRAQVHRLTAYIEDQRNRYSDNWPKSCVFLADFPIRERVSGMVSVAKRLGHATVVSLTADGKKLNLWADPIQAPKQIKKGIPTT